MSIIAKIDGVPIFSSKWEAERWGDRFGFTGTHTHVYNNQTTWMAGENHGQMSKFKPREKVFQEPIEIIDPRLSRRNITPEGQTILANQQAAANPSQTSQADQGTQAEQDAQSQEDYDGWDGEDTGASEDAGETDGAEQSEEGGGY